MVRRTTIKQNRLTRLDFVLMAMGPDVFNLGTFVSTHVACASNENRFLFYAYLLQQDETACALYACHMSPRAHGRRVPNCTVIHSVPYPCMHYTVASRL